MGTMISPLLLMKPCFSLLVTAAAPSLKVPRAVEVRFQLHLAEPVYVDVPPVRRDAREPFGETLGPVVLRLYEYVAVLLYKAALPVLDDEREAVRKAERPLETGFYLHLPLLVYVPPPAVYLDAGESLRKWLGLFELGLGDIFPILSM